MKVLHVVTVADSLIFLAGRSAWMAHRGVQTEVVASPSYRLDEFGRDEGVVTHGVPMRRAISPIADFGAIANLLRLIRARRPSVVHAHTPKGGLLGMIAAFLARVPVRVYHIHGLPFQTAIGIRRRLLMLSEWLSCRLATQVLAVSQSILDVAQREGLCPPGSGLVLGSGSINGVDLERFSPERAFTEAAELRESHGVSADALVIGFVGRFAFDKGIVTLAEAWKELRVVHPTAVLLLVGEWEGGDPVPGATRRQLENDPRVVFTGFLVDPAPAYAMMTVLAFPSRREGFGLAALEAGAMGVPVVASDIPGIRDAVRDAETGTLVEVDSADSLGRALEAYLTDGQLAAQHGEAGRKRARADFDPASIWASTLSVYQGLKGSER